MSAQDATRVVLRPVATSLPLSFLAQTVATMAFAAVQLRWVPVGQGHVVALAVLLLAVPLQLLAAVFGFLAHDPVAATGTGLLCGTWAAVSAVTLTSPSGATSPGLGVVLLGSASCLLVPALAARELVVACGVVLVSAGRFAVTGVAELDGGRGWSTAAGWTGVGLAGVALYAALALELEGSNRRTVLPVGRFGRSRAALRGGFDQQTRDLAHEPGVRDRL